MIDPERQKLARLYARCMPSFTKWFVAQTDTRLRELYGARGELAVSLKAELLGKAAVVPEPAARVAVKTGQAMRANGSGRVELATAQCLPQRSRRARKRTQRPTISP